MKKDSYRIRDWPERHDDILLYLMWAVRRLEELLHFNSHISNEMDDATLEASNRIFQNILYKEVPLRDEDRIVADLKIDVARKIGIICDMKNFIEHAKDALLLRGNTTEVAKLLDMALAQLEDEQLSNEKMDSKQLDKE